MVALQGPVALEIKALPELTWPEVKVTAWDTQLTRENFIDRLAKKQLDVPMAICAMGESEESDISAMDCIAKRMRVSIYHLISNAGQDDVALVALAKAEAFRALLEKPAVIAPGSYSHNTFANFQIIDDPEVDASQENPVNCFMAENGFPYIASRCRFFAYYNAAYGAWT